MIQGACGDDGWIRYNKPITGNYILAFNLSSDLPWDLYWEWEGNEEEVLRIKEKLKGEYEIIDAVQDSLTRTVRVGLEGGKNIINVVLQIYGISE